MGKVVPLLRAPRSWTDSDREIFARLTRFYNRCSLVDAFVDISEGHTDEAEPWICFARQGGDLIMSITKTLAGNHPGYIIQHRARACLIKDLEAFAKELLVEEMVSGSSTSI